MTAATIRDCLRRAAELSPVSDSARLDIEWLLSHVLGRDRAWLLAHDDALLTDLQRLQFEAGLLRRLTGEPMAYILEQREFWSLNLRVTPAVLIPRPETERLVEAALEVLAEASVTQPEILDLGTGSGAIALALASEWPAAGVLGVDVSAAALAVAQDNAHRLGLSRVRFALGDWCAGLGTRRFHLVVSNPPYVPAGDDHLRRGDLRFEPVLALTPGPDGLAAFRSLAEGVRSHLEPGGWLLLEHGWDQQSAVVEILRAAGYADLRTWQDLEGRDRVSGGRWGVRGS